MPGTPDSGHTGTISTPARMRRTSRNAVKPRIQYVRRASGSGPDAVKPRIQYVRQRTGRSETPDPVRSDAVKARIQCVSGSGPSFMINLEVRAASHGSATGAHGHHGPQPGRRHTLTIDLSQAPASCYDMIAA
jgi:hypothetical protein